MTIYGVEIGNAFKQAVSGVTYQVVTYRVVTSGYSFVITINFCRLKMLRTVTRNRFDSYT